MRSVPNLVRIFGIRLRLHYTCFIAVLLIIAIVVTQFPEAYPLWQKIIFGIVASLLFGLAISIRELVLISVAIIKGMPIKRVTLFVFGGLAQVTKESTSPMLERLLTVVGFLSNLLIAGIFYGVCLILINAGDIVLAGLVQWLAFMLFMLALFHFVPGFPLDGGRLLRSLLWVRTGDYERSTRIASWVGWSAGLLFTIGGLLLVSLARQWFIGMVLAFAGWVLQSAAAQSRREMILLGALQNFTVRDVMTGEYPFITQELSVGQLVRGYILATGRRSFVVVDGAKLQGIVTTRDVKKVPKQRWDSTSIGEIMTPAIKLKSTWPQQSVISVLEQMEDSEISEMPVLEEGKVIGVVAQDSLTRLIKARIELGI